MLLFFCLLHVYFLRENTRLQIPVKIIAIQPGKTTQLLFNAVFKTGTLRQGLEKFGANCRYTNL